MAGENTSEFQSSQAISSSQGDLFPEDFNFLWKSISESTLSALNMSFEELDSCDVNQNATQQLVLDEAGVHGQVQSEDNLADMSVTLPTQIPVVGSNVQSSSLPACETWPGQYNFTVSFSPQQKSTKGIAWTYSPTIDKLYVGKDVPCPINFSASTQLPSNVFIRVMALYTSPEQVTEIVTRCVNHSMDEIKNGRTEAQHLIRCESGTSVYHTDSSGRHSVLVPFENPPAGQKYSTYIFKFACFGSCSGGPNRRPLMLIFTLEMGSQVIGRRKLDVKICACPGRDRKNEEAQCQSLEGVNVPIIKPCKRKSSECVALSEIMDFTKSVFVPKVCSKKKKLSENKTGPFYLKIDDEESYEFLIQMKKFYDMCKMKRLSDTAASLSEYVQRVKNEKKD